MPRITLPRVLSTPEFEASIEELSPRVAVFDCDGTLWSGDAGSSFMHWSFETGLLSRDAADWLRARYLAYTQGEVSEVAICGEMAQVYQGLRESELRRAAEEFFRLHIEPNLFPEMQRLIANLQETGTEIWAVSSTNHWVIEEGVRRFQLEPGRVLAARVEVREDIISERILDVPTDEGKVSALAVAGVVAPDAVFGNSVHDAAMLRIARRAFPVNPTPALVARSAEMDWPVYYPASVRPG